MITPSTEKLLIKNEGGSVTKHLLKKQNLTKLLNIFTNRIELFNGLTSPQALIRHQECQTIIRLLENEIAIQNKPKKKKKKYYLQLYYLKNRDKLNKHQKERAREIREKSKLYEEVVRNGRL